jgi:hypothetical protein
MPTEIELALYSPDGRPLTLHRERTDDEGQLEIALSPGATAFSCPEVRLEVRGTAEGRPLVERLEARLVVEPNRYLTRLALDKPWYRPGETVRYRSLTLSRFGLSADREMPVRFEVRDPRGSVLEGASREGILDHGVGCGEFDLSPDMPDGTYTLVAHSPDGSFPDKRLAFSVRARRAPAPRASNGDKDSSVTKGASSNLAKLDVRFYPEGGDLIAGIENRVYFSARDASGKPVRLAGRVVDGHGRPAALVETMHQGMGSFPIEPVLGERYRLVLDAPNEVKDEYPLPPAVAGAGIVLTTGQGVFEAGRPLEFNVRAKEAGLPLVAAAWCRGVPVGQQAFVTQTQASSGPTDANPVTVALDERVGGVIRLTIYDFRTTPPKPVAERLVFRRPARRLNIHVDIAPRTYAPGSTVELPIRVTDEAGNPARAVLGLAVVDGALWGQGRGPTDSITTHFLLGTQIPWPGDFENLDFYLSDDPKASKALDLLLGTQGWRRFAEKTSEDASKPSAKGDQAAHQAVPDEPAEPPTVLDNLAELRSRYREGLETNRAQRGRVVNLLMALAFFGGLGLVWFVAMLSLLNVPCGARLWGPAIGTAVVCLLVGAVVLNPPGRTATAQSVAFASFENPLPKAQDPLAESVGRRTHRGLALALERKDFQRDSALGKADLRADESREIAAVTLAGPPREKATDRLSVPGAPPVLRKAALAPEAAKRASGPMRFVVREYAYQQHPGSPGARGASPEILYWHPLRWTDAQGRATIRFDLPASAATYRVLAEAHSDGGRIGSGAAELVSEVSARAKP